MNKIEIEFITSLATVVLFILAVIILIKYSSGALFYVIAGVALICGFFNAWLISTTGERGGSRAAKRSAKRRSRRKG